MISNILESGCTYEGFEVKPEVIGGGENGIVFICTRNHD
jgi:hypothetical protein